jgi:tRNA-splicing ligase RtcB
MTTGLDDATEEHTNLWLKDDLMDEGSWMGRQVIDELEARGILVRNPSPRGVVEEAPSAYKDVRARRISGNDAHELC